MTIEYKKYTFEPYSSVFWHEEMINSVNLVFLSFSLLFGNILLKKRFWPPTLPGACRAILEKEVPRFKLYFFRMIIKMKANIFQDVIIPLKLSQKKVDRNFLIFKNFWSQNLNSQHWEFEARVGLQKNPQKQELSKIFVERLIFAKQAILTAKRINWQNLGGGIAPSPLMRWSKKAHSM